MTYKELIQALRHCASDDEYGCLRCPGESTCDECTGKSLLDAADRLEALLAENVRLKAECDRWRETATKLWAGVPRFCGDLPRFEMHADEPPSTEGVE